MYLYKENVEDLLKYFDQCLNSEEGRKRLSNISNAIKKEFNISTSTSQEVFDSNIAGLMSKLETKLFCVADSVVILILKNKDGLFDLYAFKNFVPAAAINVATSEAFLDYLRRKPIDGWIIDNIPADDVLVFLKAYYLYREEPEISKDANNLVNEYNHLSLRMISIDNYFDENNLASIDTLGNVVLYDKDALPYSLEYLDEYRKKQLFDTDTNKRNPYYTFDKVLKMVRDDKYIGMSVRKYGRW